MKKYLMIAGSLLMSLIALQSCEDGIIKYDDPGDEAGAGQTTVGTDHHVGDVDTIPYLNQPTEEGVKNAIKELTQNFQQSLTGQYNMRGGKEGGSPASHAYQRQYSLGPDLYAQYFTVPHKDFMYGTLTSTYNVSADFNGGPLGAYTMAKNAIMPLLHHPSVDSIPEIKAINLLYYCIMAQEQADLSGPFTYLEDKQNSEEPSEYNDVESIYKGIVQNLDSIVVCLKNFENRPQWYKDEIVYNVLYNYDQTSLNMLLGNTTLNSYIKLANSLKLRMAMHIVKVEPETAKKWAEEAVASGVIDCAEEQHGLFPILSGFSFPLSEIANTWNDLRLCASFESLLMSLDHPYTKYFFLPNSGPLTNKKTGETTEVGTRIVGIRSGLLVGDSQLISLNERQGYSSFDNKVAGPAQPPLYFLKWAEVDFLRAEGALRGWEMGGSAQEFYERGIRNAYFDSPCFVATPKYNDYVNEYMAREEPVDYVQKDPMGDGIDWPSVTKIGVKWNEGDDRETKLEKIITQKYIALFPLSTEAWAEMRRTGYPKVFPVLNTDDGDGSIMQGEMIRRIPWVPTDPVALGMVETSGIPALGGPDEQATRLWWDVDAPNF